MVRLLFYSGVFLLLLSSCTSKSIDAKEAANNDSIQKYLELAVDDNLSFKIRGVYTEKAIHLISLRANDSLTRYYLFRANSSLCRLNKIESLKKNAKILIKDSKIVKDSIGLSRGFHILGYAFMMDSQNEQAIKCFFKAKKGFSSKRMIIEELAVMRNIALTQSFANDFLGSIKSSFEIIKKAKQYKIEEEVNNAYINIGNNFSYLKNEIKAIEYYKKVKFDKSNSKDMIMTNINIGDSQIKLGKYDEAYSTIKEIFSGSKYRIQKAEKNANANNLLGLYYIKIEKPKQAYYFLKKAESIFRSKPTLNGENYNQIYISEYFAQIKDTINAINAAKKSVTLSKKYKNPNDILLSIEQIIKVDKKNASQHAQDYIRINDSLQIAERSFRDKFAEIRYEKEEITIAREAAVRQKWTIAIISSIIILISILLLIITRQQNKQKEFKLLQEQQKANEEIYHLMLSQKAKEHQARQNEKKRIAIELHDGVMNKLASTRLNLNILNHKKDKKTIEECLAYVEQIYKIEQEIRSISHDLAIENFNSKNSFVALVNDFVITQNNISGSKYILEIDEIINWDNVSSSIKMNLFRIIQEASHNINKFSNAKKASISFIFDDNNICLSITDDGNGFDTESNFEGIGLKNIKQRVDSLNGKFVIQSIKGKNTSLNIAIPL